ncbi:helix-turn-helix domain-containing protein [Kineosporia babensis]|uniref:Helix-turn-helix domain-containing protein n=1 Tax=Kineosporia babensis TaxID=499548 RepID=A0A9X1NJ43_9ACTN|nr:helix-turn-helix transcriptional regulator [Kineosporia babensis]MCD5314043.1 helix-turn-helix domain-containing protein [Kineosporia babensis]
MSKFDDLLSIPTSQKKRALRSILRDMRDRAGLTQKEAADRVAWGISKLTRIENGIVSVTPGDVRHLLLDYGASEDDRAALIELARQARQRDTFSGYRGDTRRAAMHDLLDYEKVARSIRTYEPFLIPGLLQTKAYAMALLRGWGVSDDEAQHVWDVRAARQRMLRETKEPIRIDIVIREAALVTRVGTDQIMLDQLAALQERADPADSHHDVRIHILRADAGHPRGADRSLMILELRNKWLGDVVFLEDAGGATINSNDSEEEFRRYTTIFAEIRKRSTEGLSGTDETGRFVEQIDEIRGRFRPERVAS